MDQLSPHRSFTSSTKDIPGVSKHRPIPKRTVPLKGTKAMRCPRDAHLAERFTPHLKLSEAGPVPVAAVVLAWISLGCTVTMVAMFFGTSRIQRTAPEFLLFACIHVFGMFAGILSSGKVRLGYWSIISLYIAYFVSLVVNHVR